MLRSGLATIRHFSQAPAGMVMGLKYNEQHLADMLVEPELAQRLVDEYGVRDATMDGRVSLVPMVGLRVEFRVSQMGVLTTIRPMPN